MLTLYLRKKKTWGNGAYDNAGPPSLTRTYSHETESSTSFVKGSSSCCDLVNFCKSLVKMTFTRSLAGGRSTKKIETLMKQPKPMPMPIFILFCEKRLPLGMFLSGDRLMTFSDIDFRIDV